MSGASSWPVLAPLKTREGWQRVLVYGLFIFATFSIAGQEACIIPLIAIGLVYWLRRVRAGALTGSLDYPPRWLIAAFLALPAAAVLSAAIQPGWLASLDYLRLHYRLFLPLALLPALDQVRLRRVFKVYVAFVVLLSIYGLIQFRYGVDWFRAPGEDLIKPYGNAPVYPAMGEFSHHITYGGVMLMNAVFLLALSLGDRARDAWWWRAGAAAAAAATVVSLARSGWFGMGVGLGLLALLRLRRRWALAVGALGIAGLMLLGLGLSDNWLAKRFLKPGTSPLLARLLRTSPLNDVDRVLLWKAGWRGFLTAPVLGHGLGKDATTLAPFRDQVAQEHGGWTYTVSAGVGVHNIYLEVLFTMGVVGLAAFLFLWGGVFVWCAQSLRRCGPHQLLERALLQGVIAALAGSMAAGLFENNAFDKKVQTVLLLLMGLALWAGLRLRRGAPVFTEAAPASQEAAPDAAGAAG